MEISSTTPIFLNIWTIIAIMVFAIKRTSSITKFKEDTLNSIKLLEEEHINIKEAVEKHEEEHKKLDLWAKLARIETDLKWIKTALKK